LREAMPGWLAAVWLRTRRSIGGRVRRGTTDLLCSLHPVGSVEGSVQRLRASADRTGIRHVIMMVEGVGTRQRTMNTSARPGAEVLSRLRDRR
jgi:hypothetical protein